MKLRNIAAPVRHVRASRAAVAVGTVLACSGLVGFIACSDGAVTEPVARTAAPQSAISPAVAVAPAAPVAPTTTVAAADWWNPRPPTTVGDTMVYVLTIDPRQGGTPSFGSAARIVIPANAICDPATSGYGAPTWAKNCKVAPTNVTFTIRSWIGKDGTPKVTFSPDVRFVPSQTVMLYLGAGTAPTSTATPVIQWCTSQMTQCVNESATNATLATAFNPFAHSAWRRVLHLSGYNISWGKAAPDARAASQ